MNTKFVRFLFGEVWIPFFIYKGLPWACFIITIIAYSIPNVPPSLEWSCAGLSIYAVIVLGFRMFTYKGY